ncbi:MAG: hypothetical protein QGH33_19980 [Pirellulaceae bacterium]|jgi:hypothetical protein|nr:hypothetical protein [Pirellulaceae bacterium]HJN12702.1 hypothetical protein [Pirellulaceae bacterium]
MTFAKQQFRLSTLFHVTTIVALAAGFARAIGFDGILLLLFLVAIPIAVAALGVIYVRAMSWLFDVIVGPFLLR